MKKCRSLAVFTMVACLMFSGCGISVTNIEPMLSPPKLSGKMAEIDKALRKSAGEDIKLRNPSSGEYRSSFVLKDADNDGNDEVFAVYSKKSDNKYNELHMNYIRYDGGWKSVNDIIVSGDSVSDIRFIDIDGDRKKEIFLNLSTASSSANTVEGYSINNTDLTQCFKTDCSTYSGVDINSDGVTEIVTIGLDSSEKLSVASAYRVTEQDYKVISTCNVDGKVLSYRQPIVSKSRDGRTALFVDAEKSGNSFATEIIIWDKQQLKAPLYDSVSMENTITLRQAEIFARDYDGDGCCDIPFLTDLVGSGNISKGSAYITEWRRFNLEEFETVAYELINYYDGYSLDIPKWLAGRFTVVKNSNSGEWVFYEWNSADRKTEKELFRIRAFSAKKWKENTDRDYKTLASNNSTVFAVKISDSELRFNKIKDGFTILE